MRVGTRVLIAAMGLCALGCFERELRPVNPCTTSEVRRSISVETVDSVDLLFMVDNSGSMSQEQDLLRAEIPRMITILASGNRDGDPELEFTPVRSMHVGIITSDLGAGNEPPPPNDVPSCNSGLGDDGILRNTSRGGSGCSTTYPSRVFDFAQETDDPATFAAEVGCVADLGTGGCGFEQQLEATLKALSPAGPTDFVATGYAAPAFFGNTRGHAGPGGANEGFLRADSALAIVLLTDEEDCSVPAYELFYPLEYDGLINPLNLRCSRFPGALHPISRYVDGFRQLRSNPNLLVYAPIVGIPTDLVGASYEDMLADGRLREVEVDGTDMDTNPDRLGSSCNTENGEAFPPRRIIEVARGLDAVGASTTVQSICAADFGPAIDVIIEKIADALSGACLPRALNQEEDGTVACRVYELLPAPGGAATITTCAAAELEPAGTELVELPDGTEVLRELCLVEQVTPVDGAAGTERGWYYDNESAAVRTGCGETPQRIAFSLLMPPTGAEVRLNCNQAILPSSDASLVQLGTFCTPFSSPGPDDMCPMGVVPSMSPDHHFSCNPVERTCGVTCSSDADCGGAGLLGYVCDGRPVLEVVGDASRVPDVDGDGDRDLTDQEAVYGYCVNPTC